MTPEFAASYDSVNDDLIGLLDRDLKRLLEGVHATTAGRRHRIEGDAGGAFVFEVRIDSDLVWHVYWDYASRNRDGIVLIALIELEV